MKEKEIFICYICGNPFERNVGSTKKFCSFGCLAKDPAVIEKRKQTSLEKYGVDNPSKLKETKDKIKKTHLERYGVENISQLDEIKEQKKKTLKANYGVSHALQSMELIQKGKDTKLKKYGNINFNNRKKSEETCIKKYGVKNVSQSTHKKHKMLEIFYDRILTDGRMNNVIPLFSKDEFKGINVGGIYNFKCIFCNRPFQSDLTFKKIPKCPCCFNYSSLAETEIISFLKDLLPDIKIIHRDRTTIFPLELDILLPDYKIAIEYDGLYWHGETQNSDKFYHLTKTNKCLEKGIRLIHIFEDEWMFNSKVVKNRLKHLLLPFDKKIPARKCVIKEISTREKNDFLNLYHIQGGDYSNVKLGVFYLDELMAVMTFTKPRIIYSNKDKSINKYELSRFCSKIPIIGGMSKCIEYFKNNYKPDLIYSYVDRRWNTGISYEKCGFTKVSDGTPNYWYIIENKRVHRFNFRKNVLKNKLSIFDNSISEWENMQLNGYDRIWDCGSLKYELSCKNSF